MEIRREVLSYSEKRMEVGPNSNGNDDDVNSNHKTSEFFQTQDDNVFEEENRQKLLRRQTAIRQVNAISDFY